MADIKPKQPEGQKPGNFDKDMERMAALFAVLKLQYNFYFSGARKDLPVRERNELDRLFAFYRNSAIVGIANQFKFNSFAHSYTIHCDQWGKMTRAKESGVVADPRMVQALRKAEKVLEDLEKESPAEARQREAEANAAKPKDVSGSQKPAPKAPPAPAAKGASSGGAASPTPQELFEIYKNARRAAGDSAAVDPAAFERQIATQRQQILEKYKAKDVLFTVETKDGKVSLKAKVVK